MKEMTKNVVIQKSPGKNCISEESLKLTNPQSNYTTF